MQNRLFIAHKSFVRQYGTSFFSAAIEERTSVKSMKDLEAFGKSPRGI